jgi:hypothetical protein
MGDFGDRPVLASIARFRSPLLPSRQPIARRFDATLPGSFVHRPSHILRSALRQTVGGSGSRERSRARMVLRAIIRVVHIQVRRDIDGRAAAEEPVKEKGSE